MNSTSSDRIRVEQSNCEMGSAKTRHLTILSLALLSIVSLTSSSFTSLPDEFSILDQTQEFDKVLSEERARELFRRWKEKHGKVYKDSQEAEERFHKFQDNLKYVMERNADRRGRKGHRVGLNGFADMSNEEFREVYLSKVRKPGNKKWGEPKRKTKLESCESPSSLDWRDYGIVTGVKDQGECGM